MRKVVLYYPWVSWVASKDATHRIPYSVLNLVTPLQRAGIDVEIYDGRVHPFRAFMEACEDALFVGISSMTGIQLKDAMGASKRVREYFYGVPIVWGGWHASIMPNETLNEPFVDAVCVGQGERTIVDIARRALDGEKIKGIYGHELSQDLDRIPLRFLDLDNYTPHLGYLTSYGCPFLCTFCAIAKVYNRKTIYRPIDEVVEDLKYVFDNYKGYRQINLDDDNFFSKRSRVVEFCEKWNNYANVPIAVLAHVKALNMYDDSLWRKMVDSGIKIFLIGAESGNQTILDRLKKKQDVDDMLRFVEKTAKFGVQADLSCMTGFPDSDTLGDFKDTIMFLSEAGRINPNIKFKIFWVRPYAGTELYKDFVNQGIEMPETMEEWSDYSLRNQPAWVSDELEEMVRFYVYMFQPRQGWNYTWDMFLDTFRIVKKAGKLPIGGGML